MNRKGFTLIELLIVVVIIGILAAIAIPKFANTKEKAYLAAMKSDLRNLATAQESYFADYFQFGTDAQMASWNASAGVTPTVTPNSGLGWSASAAHGGTLKTCVMFSGTPTGTPTVTSGTVREGEPKCDS